MLSPQHRKTLALAHDGTSDNVRFWLAERMRAMYDGNAFAEQQLKVFCKAYLRFGSGIRALAWLEGGEHEQLSLTDWE